MRTSNTTRELFSRMILSCVQSTALILFAFSNVRAEPTTPGTASDAINDLGCARCHSCDQPTRENPCLIDCTRDEHESTARNLEPSIGPVVVILDELENRYLPVPFDHKGHAEMAATTRGCSVCHHYTPAGSAIQACKSCHAVDPAAGDLHRPSLKGAYHRQCMNCHREWSHETSCTICHAPKTGVEATASANLPTRDDIMGKMHPPIPEPENLNYEVSGVGCPGNRVLFRHKEHIDRYGLRCVECHHEDSCSRCHDAREQGIRRVRTFEEHHKPCVTCHNVKSESTCSRCHWDAAASPPPRFEHAMTGWPLGRFHDGRSCRDCHTTVPFVKLDRNCDSCHTDWDIDTFDHNATGQELSEVHTEIECEMCHTDRAFNRPPVCSECHDEDVTFPARRPGPRRSDSATK